MEAMKRSAASGNPGGGAAVVEASATAIGCVWITLLSSAVGPVGGERRGGRTSVTAAAASGTLSASRRSTKRTPTAISSERRVMLGAWFFNARSIEGCPVTLA